jgi:hypothetical protein
VLIALSKFRVSAQACVRASYLRDPRKQALGGRYQIGTPSGFKTERPADIRKHGGVSSVACRRLVEVLVKIKGNPCHLWRVFYDEGEVLTVDLHRPYRAS